MEKLFFYGSILALWITLFFSFRVRPFKVYYLFLWITYSLYSLTYEIVFGVVLQLYYYIEPGESIVYILLASLLLYPAMAVLYVHFLPRTKLLWYTIGWIVAIQVLEMISLYTKTIILTGWRVIPWSVLTYIITYYLIYLYQRYLNKKVKEEAVLF